MASLNKVMLVGNLTRDPELRVTPKGTAICQFGIAINRQYRDESGATRDDTTFVDLEAWGKTAELIGKYLHKGSSCFVEGRLRFDQWDDKESGQKRSKLKAVVENVQFLGSKGDSAAPGERSDDEEGNDTDRRSQRSQQRYSAPPPRESKQSQADADVPF